MPITINGTTGIAGVDGTASTPAMQGTDTNTGVYYGSDTVYISTGGTLRATVDNTGLTLATPITFATSATGPVLIGGTTASSSLTLQSTSGVGTTDSILFKVGNNGATTAATIDTAGNLGLGVTPSAWGSGYKAIDLSTYGGIQGTTGAFNATSNAYYNGTNWIRKVADAATLYSAYGGNHTWWNAGSSTAGSAISFTQAMTLSAAGNLGIGITSPSYALDILGQYQQQPAVGTSSSALRITSSGGSYYMFRDSSTGGDFSGVAYATGVYTSSAYPYIFIINNTERARIDASGNLLVGTTGVVGKANIWAASKVGYGQALFLKNAWSGDVGYSSLYIAKYDNNNTSSQIFVQFSINDDTTGQGQIQGNGANQVAFGSFSDARLKKNVETLPSQLSNILALRPVEFDYIDGSGHQINFIAQEMQAIYPDAVAEGKDGMLTITGWSKTEARLVSAIQELAAKVTALEARI